jgi:hypothetical protein
MYLNDSPTQYRSTADQKYRSATNAATIVGFNESTGVYDSSSYTSVYHLVSHKSPYKFDIDIDVDCKAPEAAPKEFKCLMISKILDEMTDFFHEKYCPKETKESFQDFISSLILQHMENLQYNILSLCEWYTPTLGPLSLPLWNEKAKASSKNPTAKCYAFGVFPLVALCNHSCDPNAIFVKSTKHYSASIVTSRRIRAGEEILISYKAPFTRMPFEERQNYLLENYKFECKCYACERKFSVDSTTLEPNLIESYICECDTALSSKGKSTKKHIRKLGKNASQMCPGCNLKMERVNEVGMRLELVQDFIRKERFSQAYDILVEESQFLSSNFEPNYSLFQVCQDLMRRTVVHLIHL